MKQFLQILAVAVAMAMSVAGAWAAETKAGPTLTVPPDSLSGLRPGMSLDKLIDMIGKPAMTQEGGLLGLYGGPQDSTLYGWFAVQNPNYDIPDLAVETPRGSRTIELVMAIGYDGLRTEKGVRCFQSEQDMIKAYGVPDYVFEVEMDSGSVLREAYYVKQGVSFDLVPLGEGTSRSVVAIYVTYPEYLTNALNIRRDYIKNGVGKDVTNEYKGLTAT